MPQEISHEAMKVIIVDSTKMSLYSRLVLDKVNEADNDKKVDSTGWFLATLVALHFTPVSESVSKWVVVSD